MDAGYLAMRARAQQNMIDFLFTELKLGTTLAESAALAKEAGSHGPLCERYRERRESGRFSAAVRGPSQQS
jgi:hypothetical protein